MPISKSLGRFGLADGAFGEGAQTEPVEPVRLFAGHGPVFLVGGRAPTEAVELVEQRTVGGHADDAEVAAAVRERLNADAEDVLQGEQFAEADGRPGACRLQATAHRRA